MPSEKRGRERGRHATTFGGWARRLLYVGMTRATKWVYFSTVRGRALPELARIRALAHIKPPVVTIGAPTEAIPPMPDPEHQDDLLDILRRFRGLGNGMPRLRLRSVPVDSAMLALPAPKRLMAAGNLDLLPADKLGLICSSQCPGSLILKTYDYVRELRDLGVLLVGGFHSPMERECLGILLRGKQPIVICPARSIDGMLLPEEWRQAFEAGRLLILSECTASERRISLELAYRRNVMIAAISRRLLVPHAAPESKTLNLCLDLLRHGTHVETFWDEANRGILDAGATLVERAAVV